MEAGAGYEPAPRGKGYALLGTGHAGEALGAFDAALAIDTSSESAWRGRAEALSELGEFQASAESYGHASSLDPGDASHPTGMGEALNAAGGYAEAACAFDKALSLSPEDARALLGRGIALVRTQRYSEAAESFGKAAAIDPANAAARNGRGAALYHMKKYGDAVAAFDSAIDIEPGFAPAWSNKALALAGLRDYRAAEAAWERTKGIAGWWTEPRVGKTYLYLSLGSAGYAYTESEEAISELGGEPELLASRGFAELAMRDYGSASGSFSQAAEREPGNPAHLLWQSYADYLSAETERGNGEDRYRDSVASVLRTLDKAHRLIVPEEKGEPLPPWMPREEKKPGDKEARLLSDIVYFRARCYYRLGDYDRSVSELRECARIQAGDAANVKRVLKNVWLNRAKPSLLSRWLSSPVRPWPGRILFFSVILAALGLLIAHPILSELVKPYRIDTAVYIFMVAAILGILFFPLTERPRDEDYEFSLTPDLSRDPVLAPVTLDELIRHKRRTLIAWE